MHEPHAHAETEGVDPATRERFLDRGPSPCARAGIRFGFLSLLGGALVFVLHGAAFHLTPWSQAIVNGIAKHWYPSIGQKDTTVVLFREENLERLKETYPISYLLHADVLDAIKKYNPRAVFVDFVFLGHFLPTPAFALAIDNSTRWPTTTCAPSETRTSVPSASSQSRATGKRECQAANKTPAGRATR